MAIDEDPCAFGNVGLHLGRAGTARPARAKWWIRSSISGEWIRRRPRRAAIRSQVRSSPVGPRPPVVDKVRPAQRFANGGLDVLRPIRNRHLAGNGPPRSARGAVRAIADGCSGSDPATVRFGIDQFDVHAGAGVRRSARAPARLHDRGGAGLAEGGFGVPGEIPSRSTIWDTGLPAQDPSTRRASVGGSTASWLSEQRRGMKWP